MSMICMSDDSFLMPGGAEEGTGGGMGRDSGNLPERKGGGEEGTVGDSRTSAIEARLGRVGAVPCNVPRCPAGGGIIACGGG